MKAEENTNKLLGKTQGTAAGSRDERRHLEGIKEAAKIPCAGEVENVLDIPPNALLTKVKVNIVAMPAGRCSLSEAGEVRNTQGDDKKVVIDLKRMRSVSGLLSPQTITTIETWAGAGFADPAMSVNGGKKDVLFPEVATERLQVTFNADADLEKLLEECDIILPDTPVDLILSVNDKTAWTHIGPVTLSSREEHAGTSSVTLDEKAKNKLIEALMKLMRDVMSGGHSVKEIFSLLSEYGISISESKKTGLREALKSGTGFISDISEQDLEAWLISLGVTWEGRETVGLPCFTEDVDITKLLQAEIDAGAAELKIVLRSAFACRLQLDIISEEYLLNHDVIFPGQAQALEIAEEGITTLSLPLPGTSSSWSVSSVFFTIEGNTGHSRFFPAVGPDPIDLGELLLDTDHALAAFLTVSSLSRFKTIEGVRLPLQVEKEGAEITAFLRKDDNGKVGDYVAEGTLQSQTIDQAEEQWVLLELSKPMDIQPDTGLWLEINVIRGKCWWQLGNKDDPSDGIVGLQRGIPGGTFSDFSITLNGHPENIMGRLRLKGQPVTDGAIHAIIPLDPRSGDELDGITVGNAPFPVELQFNHSVRPAGGKLDLDLQVHCPGTYTVTKAGVLYEV